MTRSIVTAVFLILSALALSSCAGRGRRTADLSRLENTSIEIRDFVTRMQSNGAICFRAWGSEENPSCDRDVLLAIFPDETAEMLISGNSLTCYTGTYRFGSFG